MIISLFAKEELESKKLAEITDHYNQVAKAIGLKAIKKFRDKSTAVSRTLDVQEIHREDVIESVKQLAKEKFLIARHKKLGMTHDSIIKADSQITPKSGTIEASIFEAIQSGNNQVEDIVNYIISNHKRPRSDQKVDEAYALHNIKWFIKKGHLEVS